MVVKPVLLFLLSQLLLSLVTFKVNAEESILLIDKSQGIDNTIDPTIKQLNDINQSLKNILPSDEALPDDEFESESLNEISPSDEALPDGEFESESSNNISASDEALPDDDIESEVILEPAGTDTEETFLLIDKTQGIDNTDSPTNQYVDDLNKSLNSILPSDEVLPVDEVEVEVESETILKPAETATEKTFLLIDNTKGIDNIDELLASPEEKINESQKNILPEKNTAQDENIDKPSTDTNIIPSTKTETNNTLNKNLELLVPTEENNSTQK